MTVRSERQGLGRGLASLIPQRTPGQPGPTEIAVERIKPNPNQPRQHFDEDELATLTASIRRHGILQPVLVTETIDGYQLVAGERRLRAAVAAGLERIPAVVRQLDEQTQLEVALVENLQREDLDPIEAATGFRRLIDEFGFTPDQIAERVDRARSTVANTLRLLELAPAVQAAIAARQLTEGHGRAIGGLPIDHQERVLDSVIDGGLSVRQTEELVRRLRDPKPARAPHASSGSTDPDLERVEEELRRALGTKVSLARSRRGGRIVIEYYSEEELGRLYERLVGATA
ncbi:MAG: ParB/RepB/Spo0J family partition protein [Chloroflexi bacterium]|nr:ParB/RepB/Spo0J family partition protein [Chloroflexota bacterium]